MALRQALITLAILVEVATEAAGQPTTSARRQGMASGERSDPAAMPTSETVLSYTIRPVPRADRTDLHIRLRFTGDADGETVLQLPRDRYGTPDVHTAVRSVVAAGRAVVSAAASSDQRRIAHGPSAGVEIDYVLSWDPARSEGHAYSPSVNASHFHFFGPQWLAWPETGKDTVDLLVEFAGLPTGWSVLSSFGFGPGPHHMRRIAIERLPSFIAGGEYRLRDFVCRGNPVRVGVVGHFVLADSTMFADAERIVCAERAWMNDSGPPFFTISITPRAGIRAGTAVENAFVCLLDSAVTRNRLNILLAHEMFHYWLLTRARVISADFVEDTPASKWAYQWVDEGFTEYFARKILHEAGLLTRAELVELANEDFEDYWRNEHRSIPYVELRRAAKEGRFMSTHQRIGYFRGALIALDWNTKIQQASEGQRSLSDAMRDVISAAIVRGGHLPERDFQEIMARYGIDAAAAFERHIIRGEPPPRNPLAYAPDFTLQKKIIYDFAPGFDIASSRRLGRLTGVDPNGHAHRSGLREGMELVSTRNSRVHDPGEPMEVTVRVEGTERVVSFFPKGPPVRVPVYLPVPSTCCPLQ